MNKPGNFPSFGANFEPDYTQMHPWEVFSANILTEFYQMRDEGYDIAQFELLAREIAALPPSQSKENMAAALANLWASSPMRQDYPYREPSDLPGIWAECPAEREDFAPPADLEHFQKRVLGAWLGRIAGCLLGKPIEGIHLEPLNTVLQKTGNFPLHRYIRAADLTEEIYESCAFPLRGRCFADTIQAAPADDDTNYTVMAAYKLIDVYGLDFSPADVAKCWLDSQPKNAYCTAERVAFVNFVNGIFPPASAVSKNAFREWIGAQIRGDYFGFIHPGNPRKAAEMAFRDASISHIKNGIYGEMFVAAMLACAAVCGDIQKVIAGGLAEIPAESRLSEAIRQVLSWHREGRTAADCIAAIHAQYDEKTSHGWCHTIPNAMVVAVALLYGEMDFGKSVCLAVSAAFDCDCNGATVGAVMGMLLGAPGIPETWTAPFNNRLETTLFGLESISVDDLCEITLRHANLALHAGK